MKRGARHRRACKRRKAARAKVGAPQEAPRQEPPCLAERARALLRELGDALTFSLRLSFAIRPRLPRRSAEYWFTMFTLLLGALALVGTWYAALRPTPSTAEVLFNTGVVEGSAGGGPRSYATPRLNTPLYMQLKLEPTDQDLSQVAVTISLPRSLELTRRCFYEVDDSRRRSCLAPNGEGRVNVDRLASGQTLRITAVARVVHRIEGRESVEIQMRSASTDTPSRRQIDLYSPKGSRGEEAARAMVEEEVSEGPLRWDDESLQAPEDVFEALGKEWQFLDPWQLHGLRQVPYGRMLDVRSLVHSRVLGAKIVTFRSVVRSASMRVRTFRVKGSNVRATREVFAVGPRSRPEDLWCSATRSTAQPPLRVGEPVLVRAAVVGWGIARPDGRPSQAALLICPVVHLTDAFSHPLPGRANGGTSAPVR